jgi:hypothetical protein
VSSLFAAVVWLLEKFGLDESGAVQTNSVLLIDNCTSYMQSRGEFIEIIDTLNHRTRTLEV